MSENVSALMNARFDGLARIEEAGPQGMITLRGDFSSSAMKSAVADAAGSEIPQTGKISYGADTALCWMSPDELLVLCPYHVVDDKLAVLTAALASEHALTANVSDARALFRLSGSDAREVLAKLCPVDLSRDAFAVGQFRRTRMAQVPAAIWFEDDDTACVICFRSVAQYVFDLLKVSAQPGSATGVL